VGLQPTGLTRGARLNGSGVRPHAATPVLVFAQIIHVEVAVLLEPVSWVSLASARTHIGRFKVLMVLPREPVEQPAPAKAGVSVSSMFSST
jgi:hypothetical protein